MLNIDFYASGWSTKLIISLNSQIVKWSFTVKQFGNSSNFAAVQKLAIEIYAWITKQNRAPI